MYHIVEAMSRWLAPILSFTADEIWSHIPGERCESVFLERWYEGLVALDADDRFDRPFWERVLETRVAVAPHLEAARKSGAIGSSLDAELDLYCEPELLSSLQRLGDELRFALITSSARLLPLEEKPSAATDTDLEGLAVLVTASAQTKCVRCWHHRADVGSDSEHPELCVRCVENVAGAGEFRRYA